jgi:hypothetical protein
MYGGSALRIGSPRISHCHASPFMMPAGSRRSDAAQLLEHGEEISDVGTSASFAGEVERHAGLMHHDDALAVIQRLAHIVQHLS